jgi:flagellar M-ring protein FliF
MRHRSAASRAAKRRPPAPPIATGVPGALSNQPQATATAPITGAPASPASEQAPARRRAIRTSDTTVNYEVDKTIRYVQQPMGGLKRLSVAVVVNYKRETDKDGKVTMTPLSDTEKTQITDLVKEAMGFSKERGDTLNVRQQLVRVKTEKEVPIVEVPCLEKGGIRCSSPRISANGCYGAIVIVLPVLQCMLKPMLRKCRRQA